jgi:activator of 2-hydroxyglutaryl-CoA dehydratase
MSSEAAASIYRMGIEQTAEIIVTTGNEVSGHRISRYLGITIEDVGKLSLESKEPTAVSGICAVLAETDVINMVSRGIATRDILKGIHVAMAKRLVNLLRLVKAQGKILVTGGLGLDVGLVSAIRENMVGGVATEVINHELSPMAGAIGCGIWGGYRHVRLAQQPRAA